MQFTSTLLHWYEEHKRELPWRGETDPFKIWVSEIILQQTRVQQGWDYYLRFISTFPTIRDLANAPEEQVLRVWQGLGYYSRARNMHFAAKQIRNEHHGKFPDKYEDIRKLKGIGDYTAAAIGSIAFGLPYPAVDGNVLRIISRIFGICDDIALPATKTHITDICKQWIPEQQPGTFNQACMEFGAIWCTPKNPQCEQCPFRSNCYALTHGIVDSLPIKSNKIVKRERFFHFTCYLHNDSTILERRTDSDIWRNMYQFPLTESQEKNFQPDELQTKEILTHQIIFAGFSIVETNRLPILNKQQQIVRIDELDKFPMPKIMTEFIQKHLDNERQQP